MWKAVDPPLLGSSHDLGVRPNEHDPRCYTVVVRLDGPLILIGVFEAGFGPGVAFFLSWFYSRQEMALRYGLFIGTSALANCFASSLAYGIV